MSKSFKEYEDAKENEEGTVPESVIPESIQLFPQPQLIIPETQVSPSFPDTLAIFPANIFDLIILLSVPGAITCNSSDPPPLPLLQVKVNPETQEVDCESSSEDSANKLLKQVEVNVQCSTASPKGKCPSVAVSAHNLIVVGSLVLDVAADALTNNTTARHDSSAT
jgi:hypothetical protein